MTFFTIISLLLSCSTSSSGACIDDHRAVVAFAAERFGMRVSLCKDTEHFCNSFQEVRDLCPLTCGQCFRTIPLPDAVCEDNNVKAAALLSQLGLKGMSTCAEAKQLCPFPEFYSICPMTCGICSNASDRHFMMMNTFMTSPKAEHQSSEIDLKGYISTGELTTNAVVNANEANEKYPVSCTENCCKDCRDGLDSLSWSSANDMWGWEAADGTQLAVVGLTDRTAIVDVTYDSNPRLLGYMPQLTEHIRVWKDVKIWDSHAFICSEAPGFGLQYIDLKEVLKFDAFPRVFQQQVLYTDDSYKCHNLIMNRDTPVLYTARSSSCKSIARIPLKFNADGTLQQDVSVDGAECIENVVAHVHDAQCVIYDGPDQRFLGEEICFLSTDLGKSVAVYSWTQRKLLDEVHYKHSMYSHQSWISKDGRFMFHGDELAPGNTRTQVFDISSLTNVLELEAHVSDYSFVSHNQYVADKLLYQANYAGGLRVLTWNENGQLQEVGYFDGSTAEGAEWRGSWTVYPYFSSGVYEAGKKVVITGSEGLHVVQLSKSLEAYLQKSPRLTKMMDEAEFVEVVIEVTGVSDSNKDSVCDSFAAAVRGTVTSCILSGPKTGRRMLTPITATLSVEIFVKDAAAALATMNADNFIANSVTLPTGVKTTSITATKKGESTGTSSDLINIVIYYVLPFFGVLSISVAAFCYCKCVDVQKKNVEDFGDSKLKDVESGAGSVEKIL